MPRISQSLAGFVEATCERAANWWHTNAGRDLLETWDEEEQHDARLAMMAWCEELVRLCRSGQYRVLTKAAWWWDDYLPDQILAYFDWVDENPVAHELAKFILFAERIDYFLAALEREGTTRQLARDCRDHLDLLLVLADWCQDAGLPRAATEARHLHALVRSYRFFP